MIDTRRECERDEVKNILFAYGAFGEITVRNNVRKNLVSGSGMSGL
jgi:hypothetical protein